MSSETNDGLSSCSNFLERASSYKLESDKPVLPEMEHLRGETGEGGFEFSSASERFFFQNIRRRLVFVTSASMKST